jgi:hypothetical protein
VQGLCRIRPAVVYHDRLFLRQRQQQTRIRGHAVCQRREIIVGQAQVDKTRGNGFGGRETPVSAQRFGNLPRYCEGVSLVRFGGRQRAVALKMAKVGAVGDSHRAVGRVIAALFKRGGECFR